MIKVIGSYVSPYVRKVLIALELKGLDYEVDPITAFFGNDEFERLSPLRRIPVLIDGDVVVNDSSVICAYIDERYPGSPLLPADPADRARVRWLEEFADGRLGDILIWGLFYQRFVRPMVWGEPTDEKRVAQMIETEIPRALDYLESQAPDDGFVAGDFGLADIAVPSFFRNAAYVDYLIDAQRWPRTAGWVERALAHPAFVKIKQFEDIQRSASIAGRRQALAEAGARLSAKTLGERQPRRGMMPL